MNYQHAFHAGNFADVHKHVVLARILAYLQGKPAAFRVIDTHAGAGRYDLRSVQASRGGEWQGGIGRLLDRPLPDELKTLLAPYLDVVQNLNPGGMLRTYPGSPLLALALIRPQDRLIACELEPRAAAALKAVLHDRRAKVLALDGWTALGASVPPKERRGVVLVDPPFEEAADFTRLASAVAAAHRKWPTGIYMLWYPIKERDAPDALARRLRKLAIPGVLRCEITMGLPRADAGLVGSGLIVINPPFKLDADLKVLLPALAQAFAAGAACRIDWLAAVK
ncbi:MAG: 23S rRNA (adenine(2030)-N(6))-methyltransferase RlmJ [Xanthobacteraceae bacterium]